MMYKEEEQMLVQKKYKKYLGLSIAIVVAFTIVAFSFMTRMTQWKGALFLSIGVCVAIFILTIYALPNRSYYVFLSDIIEGQSREINVPIIKVNDRPVYKDNKLLYYEIEIIEEGVERMLLFDANKGNPGLKAGDEAVLQIHENYIIDIKEKSQMLS